VTQNERRKQVKHKYHDKKTGRTYTLSFKPKAAEADLLGCKIKKKMTLVSDVWHLIKLPSKHEHL
jgi:cytoplasmic iron level regulating protein YaaA (DUF328/UPF0246 family)